MKTEVDCQMCVRLLKGGYQGECVACGKDIKPDDRRLLQLETFLSTGYDMWQEANDLLKDVITIPEGLKIRDYDLYVDVIKDNYSCGSNNKLYCERPLVYTQRQAMKKYDVSREELAALVTPLKHNDQECKMRIFGMFDVRRQRSKFNHVGYLELNNVEKVAEYVRFREYHKIMSAVSQQK